MSLRVVETGARIETAGKANEAVGAVTNWAVAAT